ncbi:hypothetical protein ACA910_003906 [Epithemia clementina (nom. ined.)]
MDSQALPNKRLDVALSNKKVAVDGRVEAWNHDCNASRNIGIRAHSSSPKNQYCQQKHKPKQKVEILLIQNSFFLYTLVLAILVVLFIQVFLFQKILLQQRQHHEQPGQVNNQLQLRSSLPALLRQRQLLDFQQRYVFLRQKGRDEQRNGSFAEDVRRRQQLLYDRQLERLQRQSFESYTDGNPTAINDSNYTISVMPSANCSAHGEIPLVIMAFKRVEYMQQLIESIRVSDFPNERVPIVISHDGRVPEMMEYVEQLRKNSSNNGTQFHIVQIVHPFSCYEHPNSFPGNDSSLNVGYAGDSYGNPRSEWATCCKHHFTWMLNTVFRNITELQPYDTFFFLEEDYVVSRTIYSSLCNGLDVAKEREQQDKGSKDTMNSFFAIVGADPNVLRPPTYSPHGSFTWNSKIFKTGPMTLNRRMFDLITKHYVEYCTKYDEYNWDWTLYHLMADGFLPHSVLLPKRYQLVKHIGIQGMHASEHLSKTRRKSHDELGLESFLRSEWTHAVSPRQLTLLAIKFPVVKQYKPFGGWTHPSDMQHCLEVFGHTGPAIEQLRGNWTNRSSDALQDPRTK